ncbi:hypothetical protein GPECTOR_1g258 [Gonium pectorale]|uniref:sn-1-specific diacylglycerol lipase n=1 Tax=Gonium pectorale TaxID=33097 RepID=A0A150H2R7_GONPE|nr:hypothetical protein GPECTOR_1g258 [Gonium pectorale]|eukprot:KXZ56293.1 hypothetical protein GPECTOR_1g258 [Gonium pectorale]
MFGRVDMTFTDHLAALTLVGLRHHHTKPALTYASAPPPEWLTCSGPRDSGAASVAWRRDGSDGGDGLLKPPALVQLTASDRLAERTDATGSPCGLPGGVHLGSLAESNGAPPTTSNTAAPANGAPPTTSSAGFDLQLGARRTQPATALDALEEDGTDSVRRASAANGNGISDPPAGLDGNVVQYGDLERQATGLAAEHGLAADSSNRGSRVTPGSGLPSLPLPPPLSFPSRRDWDGAYAELNVAPEVLEEALHYMRFATAVYGWKMYLWINRQQVTCCCRLCWGRDCGCCRQASHFLPSRDPDARPPAEGCCSPAKLLEREAITQITGVPDTDVLHVSYENEVGGLLPYYVALDRQRQALVVAVRGSLSIHDAVTDLLCEPDVFDVPGVTTTDEGGRRVLWAHRGILSSAKAVAADLQRLGILEALLRPWPEDDAAAAELLRSFPERTRGLARRLHGTCAGWRLVVTGHSLGGGVTGLLGPLLQRQFPSLRCWAFAPPAGLLSPQAAELTHSHCISVVHAKDMIPRLSVASMEQLIQELVSAAAHCSVSKATVLGGMLHRSQRPGRRAIFLPYEELSTEQKRALLLCSHQLAVVPMGRTYQDCKLGSQFAAARSFVPPGHVLYLERRKQQQETSAQPDTDWGCCTDGAAAGDKGRYGCRWIRVEDLVDRGLVVSRSMFLDHLPDTTLKAIEQALAQARQREVEPSPKGSAAVAADAAALHGEDSRREAASIALTVLS